MAGLVPAIPIRETPHVQQYFVYILASRPGGALYVDVTNNLVRRVYEHKNKMVEGHTKRYGIDRLVYFEVHETAYQALEYIRRVLSRRKMTLGATYTMTLQVPNQTVGIAGTSPAMTAE